MAYIIVDIDTGDYAHHEISRLLPIGERNIPFRFYSYQEAMEVFEKIPIPHDEDYMIIEDKPLYEQEKVFFF